MPFLWAVICSTAQKWESIKCTRPNETVSAQLINYKSYNWLQIAGIKRQYTIENERHKHNSQTHKQMPKNQNANSEKVRPKNMDRIEFDYTLFLILNRSYEMDFSQWLCIVTNIRNSSMNCIANAMKDNPIWHSNVKWMNTFFFLVLLPDRLKYQLKWHPKLVKR